MKKEILSAVLVTASLGACAVYAGENIEVIGIYNAEGIYKLDRNQRNKPCTWNDAYMLNDTHAKTHIYMIILQDGKIQGHQSLGFTIKANEFDEIHWKPNGISTQDSWKVTYTEFKKMSGPDVLESPPTFHNGRWSAEVSTTGKERYSWVIKLTHGKHFKGCYKWDPYIEVK
jgi:hypothetical protein